MNVSPNTDIASSLSEAELDARVRETEHKIRAMADWYDDHIPQWRKWSFQIRAAVIVLVALGVLLPILGGPIPTQRAFACIALAGVIVGLDRWFLISHRWAAYAEAQNSLLRIAESLLADYQKRKLTWDGVPSVQDGMAVIAVCEQKMMQAFDERDQEIGSWTGGMLDAFAGLRGRLSRGESGGRRSARTGAEGGVQLNLSNVQVYERLTLTTDDGVKREISHGPLPREIALNGVKAGMRRLEFVFEQDGHTTEASRLVMVKPDEITTVDFTAEAA